MGLMFFIYDHILTDGLGCISTICSIADNYSPSIFPKIMQNIKEESFLQKLFHIFTFPFLLIYYFIYYLIIDRYDSPLYVPKPCGRTKIAISKEEFNIKDFYKIRKTLNISFNDIIVSSISLSIGNVVEMKRYKEYANKTRMRLMLPLCRKHLPKSTNDIDLDNKANGIFCDITVLKDITSYGLKKIHYEIRKNLHPTIQSFYLNALYFAGYIMTWPLGFLSTKTVTRKMDLTFTNVPGSSEELYFEGVKCEALKSAAFAGKGVPFLILISYNDKFSISLGVDEKSLVQPDLFVDLICKNLNNILNFGKSLDDSEQSNLK